MLTHLRFLCLGALMLSSCSSIDKIKDRDPSAEKLSCKEESGAFSSRIEYIVENSNSLQEGTSLRATIKLSSQPLASFSFNSQEVQYASSWTSDLKEDYITLEIQANVDSGRSTADYILDVSENCKDGVFKINLSDFYRIATFEVPDNTFDHPENLAALKVTFNSNFSTTFTKKKLAPKQFILLSSPDGSYPETLGVQLRAVAMSREAGQKDPVDYNLSTETTHWIIQPSGESFSFTENNAK